MILQLTDLRALSILEHKTDLVPYLSLLPKMNLRTKGAFELTSLRSENARGEFTFRTSRVTKLMDKTLDFNYKAGLKNPILKAL